MDVVSRDVSLDARAERVPAVLEARRTVGSRCWVVGRWLVAAPVSPCRRCRVLHLVSSRSEADRQLIANSRFAPGGFDAGGPRGEEAAMVRQVPLMRAFWLVVTMKHLRSDAAACVDTLLAGDSIQHREDAQRAWDASEEPVLMLRALGVLADRRWLGRAACVSIRCAIERLAIVPSAYLAPVLDLVERWVANMPIADQAIAVALHRASDEARDGAPGPEAQIAMAIRVTVSLLEPEDPGALYCLEHIADLVAGALWDSGRAGTIDDCRRQVAADIRNAIVPWDLLAASDFVELFFHDGEPDRIPF